MLKGLDGNAGMRQSGKYLRRGLNPGELSCGERTGASVFRLDAIARDPKRGAAAGKKVGKRVAFARIEEIPNHQRR